MSLVMTGMPLLVTLEAPFLCSVITILNKRRKKRMPFQLQVVVEGYMHTADCSEQDNRDSGVRANSKSV